MTNTNYTPESLETSTIVIEAIEILAEMDGCSFMELWENGFTDHHTDNECVEFVKNYIVENTNDDELDDDYSWGITTILIP